MRNKLTEVEEAIAGIRDGMTVMIGGFGVPGTPFTLLEELVRQAPKNLTLIKNDANEIGMGVDLLLKAGLVEKLIASHIGLNARAVEQMNEGRLKVEFNSQGILAERIRAAGAGLLGIVTDIGVGTMLQNGKTAIDVGGRTALLETALKADYALIHAAQADTFGNLKYAATARNFSPLMAMAADTTVVEAEEIVALGKFAPEEIHTPGPFVHKVVGLPVISEAYDVVRRA
ncbi:CoA transferase subunit A [Mesorhizobium sp. M2A.F.Ca.ET.042.01.1.1]|uniref:CoA transferase subunit A n=1 Tax=Mesorhizobium sp. M2A.F.Ca.ET.042.01.1.1 TaxID=2496745 RepID=UPI000FCBA2B7|nr:CoA transferase subunit A [Mesorhizobium sp. M2A.F.Ca.ET.042.01.1.1]RUX12695.1 CoA transferase subunit A [Mesorhizobium sp. M2A.F.Ca.ET.042.01.1.1]